MKTFYIYGIISLICAWNEKCFRQVVEKIKTHILRSVTFFRKLCRLWDNVEKYGRARQPMDGYNTAHALEMLDK